MEIVMKVDIKYLHTFYKEGIYPPLSYGTVGSAGLDVRACIPHDLVILPQQVVKIPLGFALDIKDRNVAVQLLPRSGLGTQGIILANTVGLIDSDYQGEITAPLWNRSDKPIQISVGDRIGQIIFIPVLHPTLNEVDEFSETTLRGTNGFNSTGIK